MTWLDSSHCWLLTDCLCMISWINRMHLLLSFIPFIILLCSHTHLLICSVLNPTLQITVQTHASYSTLPYDILCLHYIQWCTLVEATRTFLADVWFGIGIDVDSLFQCQLTYVHVMYDTDTDRDIQSTACSRFMRPVMYRYRTSQSVCLSCLYHNRQWYHGLTGVGSYWILAKHPHYLYDIILHTPSIGHRVLYWYCRPARAPLIPNVQICVDAIIHTWCTCTVPMCHVMLCYPACTCTWRNYVHDTYHYHTVNEYDAWRMSLFPEDDLGMVDVPYHDILICSFVSNILVQFE
jgi:hypothetical protein